MNCLKFSSTALIGYTLACEQVVNKPPCALAKADRLGGIDNDDIFKDDDPDEQNQWCQIQRTGVWQITPDRPVNRLKQTRQPVPYRCDKLLAKIQDLKVNKPAHDDMNHHDEKRHAEQKRDYLEN
jgi:hypothetical protein